MQKLIPLAFIVLSGLCPAQDLDSAFKARALEHVRYLAGLGGRLAGAKGNEAAIRYVKEQMEKAGLSVAVEPFEFSTFNLEKAVLKAGGHDIAVERVLCDPFSGPHEFSGKPAFLKPDDLRRAEVRETARGRIAITMLPANPWMLSALSPKAVVYVSTADFERLAAAPPETVELKINGREERIRTANLAGTLGPASGRYVILSAHLDSVDCPGANDNASGVAVLLELARYYKTLKPPPPYGMRFVAFGAEEAGRIGSKAYLRQHKRELEDCILVFNMDTIGGGKEIYAEGRGGVQGIEKDEIPDLKADASANGSWILLRESALASNVPPALQDAITGSAKELGYELRMVNFMGSDQLTFARAGIVATNIAVAGGAKTHSPEDTADKLDAAGLEKAGRLVRAVVAKMTEKER